MANKVQKIIYQGNEGYLKVYLGSTLLWEINSNTNCEQQIIFKFAVIGECIWDYYERTYPMVFSYCDYKWYSLNNNNEYEEYGVIQAVSNLDVTPTFIGKLVEYNSHEYEWNGTEWVDLGEVIREGETKLFVGYSSPYNPTIVGRVPENGISKIQFEGYWSYGEGACFVGTGAPVDEEADNNDLRIFQAGEWSCYYDRGYGRNSGGWFGYNEVVNLEMGNYYLKNLNTGEMYFEDGEYEYTGETPIALMDRDYGKISYVKFYDNDGNLWADIKAKIDENGQAYFEVTYSDGTVENMSEGNTELVSEQQAVGTVSYPKQYETLSDPTRELYVDDICQLYNETNLYVGMTGYVNGEKYVLQEDGYWHKVNMYHITWLNWDGSFLYERDIEEGQWPDYWGEYPSREPDGDKTYDFVGWDPSEEPVYSDRTYTAVFNESVVIIEQMEDPANYLDKPYVMFYANQDSYVGIYEYNEAHNIEYSMNSVDWEAWPKPNNGQVLDVKTGDAIYFRGIYDLNRLNDNNLHFYVEGNVSVRGNINALWNYQDLTMDIPVYAACNMFSDCTALTNAINLQLPAETLSQSCYQNLFAGCSNLMTAPIFRGKIVDTDCYQGLFFANGAPNMTEVVMLCEGVKEGVDLNGVFYAWNESLDNATKCYVSQTAIDNGFVNEFAYNKDWEVLPYTGL